VELLQQIINGLSLGSLYALIALGYTMVYGIIKLINFAHGDIYMIGAFTGYYVTTYLNLPFIPTLLLAMIGSVLVGIVVEKVAYKPLRKSPRITLLITAIGVSLLLENLMRYLVGPNPQTFPSLIKDKTHEFLGLQINNIQLMTIIISVVLMILLQLIVYKTKTGKAMRAASYDIEAAALMGINVDNIISFTFAIGSALAGAAGVLVALAWTTIDPYMGIMPGLKAFVAAVLGGIGVIPGALLGGMVMGMVETLSKATNVTSRLSDVIAFSMLIIILLIKPSGLLGKVSREKV
jgi:branched-chain amino acid transport system permease protein